MGFIQSLMGFIFFIAISPERNGDEFNSLMQIAGETRQHGLGPV